MHNVLIMAGGQSSRMRNSTHAGTHKALVTVFDIPLIELNLLYAVIYGCGRLWISVAACEQELLSHVQQLQKVFKNAFSISIEIIVEDTPLGTIGAARFVNVGDEDVLVLNVDNLLDLDLNAFSNSHVRSKAAMTIASHHEPFRIPFGQLVINGDDVVDYLEKPEQKILVSSGTYILGAAARRIIDQKYPGQRIDIPALCKEVLAQGDSVHSYFHQAIWSDINDKNTLERIRETQRWPLIERIEDLRRQLV